LKLYMLDCKVSYEPMQTSAYIEDLRWHMVWHKKVLGLSCKQIGNHLRKCNCLQDISYLQANWCCS